MQRREQQKRSGGGGGGGNSYLGGGVSGYSSIPQQRFEAPDRVPSPAASSNRAPAFKGSGMKLGSKKTKQAELLDALGGEGYEDSAPSTPTPREIATPKDPRGGIPEVKAER